MLAEAIVNILLNGAIIILLSMTIGYCWILNRRVKILQDSRGELAILLKHFDESTKRASESIVALQTASKKIGENIQLKMERTNFLIDDLAFMLEKGEKLADKLEANFAVNRARNKIMAEQSEKVVKSFRAEHNLEDTESTPTMRAINGVKEKTAASLEAVLERVSARKTQETEVVQPIKNESFNVWQRSKAEQDLLDMIKAGIKG